MYTKTQLNTNLINFNTYMLLQFNYLCYASLMLAQIDYNVHVKLELKINFNFTVTNSFYTKAIKYLKELSFFRVKIQMIS